MHSGVFTALAVSLLTASTTAQSVPLTATRADHVVVFKQERKLELLSHGKVIKIYRVALGGAPVGPKSKQGDHKTPEGVYVLDFRNAHASSTNRSTFRIRVSTIGRLPDRMECRLEAVSLFTDCLMASAL
jgi:murein L,D-transpeptidase YafK